MSDTDSIVQARTSEVSTITDTLNMNLQLITDRTPAAALNLPGAGTAISTAKTSIEAGLNRLAQINNDIDAATKQVTAKGKQSGAAYMTAKASVDTLKKETEQNKTLLEIRKAQTESLKEKYAAANHSSYLGLWRPLSDETRVALFVLSIILCLVAIVTAVFYFKDNMPSMPSMPSLPSFGAAPAVKPAERSTNFFGGALRRLFPNKP